MRKGIIPPGSRDCARLKVNNQSHGRAAFLRWETLVCWNFGVFPVRESVQGEHGQEELGRDAWTGTAAGQYPSRERADQHRSPALHPALNPTAWTQQSAGIISPPATRLRSFANTPHKSNRLSEGAVTM